MSRNRTAIDWQEYEHFAGYGWDESRVAEALGVRPGSLRTALARRAARDTAQADTAAEAAA